MPAAVRSACLKTSRRVLSLLLLAAGFVCCTGCGGGIAPAADSDHIKTLTDLYISYMAANGRRPPPNEAALKEYLQKLPDDSPTKKKVTDVDSVFVSPRDGQPYAVVYAKDPKPQGGIIVYEKQGSEGKRFVGTAMGAVQEMEEGELTAALPKQ